MDNPNTEIRETLDYLPPFRWDLLLDFLALRAIPGVEKVKNGIYSRTVRIVRDGQVDICGWLQAENDKANCCLTLTLSSSLREVLPEVCQKARCLFDLDCDPQEVAKGLQQMNTLQENLFIPGIRIPGCFDPFEMSVRAVLGQQITIKAATTLAGRLAERFGKPLDTGIEGLITAFPTAGDISALADNIENCLGTLGIIAARSRTIRSLADIISSGEISFAEGAVPEDIMNRLQELPGIGPWTANYVAMRALGWTDAFPATDLGIKKALAPRNAREILSMAEGWRPFRSYAAMCLWNKQ